MKIEFLFYCQSGEKLCASTHNLSLLLEKTMCNDTYFKSCNMFIENYDSFDVKNQKALSSIGDKEWPLCDLKVKVLCDIFEQIHQEKISIYLNFNADTIFRRSGTLWSSDKWHKMVGWKGDSLRWQSILWAKTFSGRKVCSNN